MGASFPPQIFPTGAHKRPVIIRSAIIYSENPRAFGYAKTFSYYYARQGLERSGWAAWMLEPDVRCDSRVALARNPKPRKAPKTK